MIEIYIDGASSGNPGLSGAGIFIKGDGSSEQHAIHLGIMNNHEAEFNAFLHALHICVENNYQIVSFRTDSQLVANAVEKRYVKNALFSPMLHDALQIIDTSFELFFIKWIPSSQNSVADTLARKAILQQ